MLSDSVCANAREGDIGGPLKKIALAHPHTIIGSYPFQDEDRKPNTNLVVRSRDPEKLAAAMTAVKEMLARAEVATSAALNRFESPRTTVEPQRLTIVPESARELARTKPLRRRGRPFRSPGTSFTGIAAR